MKAPKAESTIPIAELRPGQQVAGIYACIRKDRLITRAGNAYLAVELRDRSGTIHARAFRQADHLAAQFAANDIVTVRGQAIAYSGETQLELVQIEKVAANTVDPAAFLPTAYRDRDELEGFLEHLVREVHHTEYRGFLEATTGDQQLRKRFRTAPCTRAGHHAYIGGLLEHTVAVATLAFELCQLYPRLNSDLLLTAAIVHDVGKVAEFTYGATFGLTPAGQAVGHTILGVQLLERYRATMTEANWLALTHCVLAHHGPDILPTRRFEKAEAAALYRLNQVDIATHSHLTHTS